MEWTSRLTTRSAERERALHAGEQVARALHFRSHADHLRRLHPRGRHGGAANTLPEPPAPVQPAEATRQVVPIRSAIELVRFVTLAAEPPEPPEGWGRIAH